MPILAKTIPRITISLRFPNIFIIYYLQGEEKGTKLSYDKNNTQFRDIFNNQLSSNFQELND